MAYTDIDEALLTDLQSATTSYQAGEEPWNKNEDGGYDIDPKDTEQHSYIADWRKWHGIYRKIPEYAANVNKIKTWVMGKGFEADEATKKKINRIKGIGNEGFNTILGNQIATYKIAGDSYADISRDTGHKIANLRPLNPGSIRINANKFGMITGYDQVSSTNPNPPILAHWEPNEMFHLSNGRIADEIHGIPSSEKLQSIIKKRGQALGVLSVALRRFVMPLIMAEVDTDDPTEMAAVKTKFENIIKLMEIGVFPKDTAEFEIMESKGEGLKIILPYYQLLQNYFIQSDGIPEIILGSGVSTTEATAKILYLAFQQTIEAEQLYVQEQVKNQLGWEIDLVFPASIDPSLLTDARKNTGDDVTDNDPTREVK